MALAASWHSGPAADDRPASLCFQLFDYFHGRLKSPEQLNIIVGGQGPSHGVSSVVNHPNSLELYIHGEVIVLEPV